MNGFWRSARKLLRRNGIDVSDYFPELDWERNFLRQLQAHQVSVALDVGANSGQYATGLRQAHFAGRIVSFEPLSGPFAALERKAAADPQWECRRCALGDVDGTISINVAGNEGASSSVLPMLKRHEDAFPPANYVGSEQVSIHRLDSVASEVLQPNDVAYLKIDVQGFERQVIEGGLATVKDRCVGLQLELSFQPLYEGGMLIREALELADSLGFTLAGLLPGFSDPRNGRMLQADGIFFRGTV